MNRISVAFGSCEIEKQVVTEYELRKKINAAPTDTIVCGCGTMDWRKGYDLFIQTAFAVCRRLERSDVRFVWIGQSMSRETEIEYDYEIELLGLQNHFFRTGEVEFPSKYFAESNVFFLSSREDPFPLVMIEAARQGLPIVCFDDSGGATEFVNSEIGATVPMLDIDAAAQAIVELIDDKELASKKGEAAASKSRSYTVERMCEEIHRVVVRVSESNSARLVRN